MRPGSLRCRVTLQSRSYGRDDYGSPVTSWADYATVWASIRPVRGDERWYPQQHVATATHEVVTRYLRGFSPIGRVAYGPRTFDVLSIVDVEERHRELRMLCRERVDKPAEEA